MVRILRLQLVPSYVELAFGAKKEEGRRRQRHSTAPWATRAQLTRYDNLAMMHMVTGSACADEGMAVPVVERDRASRRQPAHCLNRILTGSYEAWKLDEPAGSDTIRDVVVFFCRY